MKGQDDKKVEIQLLSNTYKVTVLNQTDIPSILNLCSGNPQYYQYCPPAVTEDSIKKDLSALPDGKTLEDKYYLGFWMDNELVAVLDLILKYPNEKTAFIGFFMMNASMQGKGIGSCLIEEACAYLKEQFSFVRLGYVKGNKQSQNFWTKNLFCPTGVIAHTDSYDIVIMERTL